MQRHTNYIQDMEFIGSQLSVEAQSTFLIGSVRLFVGYTKIYFMIIPHLHHNFSNLDKWNMSQFTIKGYCTIVVFGWTINTLFKNTHLDDVTPNCLSVAFNQRQDTKINVFFFNLLSNTRCFVTNVNNTVIQHLPFICK